MSNGSGGSNIFSWIIIIVGVLIALTLVGYFSADKSGTNDSGSLPRATQPDCGLVVNEPIENSIVMSQIRVSGYLKSCGISSVTSNYGTVHIVDANGDILSKEVPLSIVGNWVGQPAAFSVLVSMEKEPVGENGFLVFKNHDRSGTLIRSFQIPVLFSH